jgi:hypothetical protein
MVVNDTERSQVSCSQRQAHQPSHQRRRRGVSESVASVQAWFRLGCSGLLVQAWFRLGSGLVQAWFRLGSGLVQVEVVRWVPLIFH